MHNYIQNLCYSIGKQGCYVLCLCNVASEYLKKQVNVLEETCKAIKAGYITFNWCDWGANDNCYVKDAARFLQQMTGKKWAARHDVAGYQAKKCEYVIRRYELTETGKVSGHFERDNFLPYHNSRISHFGKEVSTRVLTVLGDL